jgi:large subunit ribosomal protein L18e
MKVLKKSNEHLLELVTHLKVESTKQKAPIWRDIAQRLEKPNRNWAEVNISHIKRHANKNDTIIIPGKLLGAGQIDIPVTVAAYNTSNNARDKIVKAGGKFISIQELVKTNPKGTGVRIFK